MFSIININKNIYNIYLTFVKKKMMYKFLPIQKILSKREQLTTSEAYYPLYFTLMGFVFGSILVLSAMNDFLFFEWLAISMSIVFGLIVIHLSGKNQTIKSKS